VLKKPSLPKVISKDSTPRPKCVKPAFSHKANALPTASFMTKSSRPFKLLAFTLLKTAPHTIETTSTAPLDVIGEINGLKPYSIERRYMTVRYQRGNLTIRKRNTRSDVWQFRWMEDGRQKSVLVGTVDKLPTRADAERAVDHLRLRINSGNPQQQFHSVTVGSLIDRYLEEEIPRRVREDTASTYRGILKNWIRPRWGDQFLEDVKAVRVETWLESIDRAPVTKAHIRNLMHSLFNSALRWELLDKNPITLVRQSQKPLKDRQLMTVENFRKLLTELKDPYYTMVLVDGCLGLRVSELLALRWGDVDWENLTLFIQRSTVGDRIYPTKTKASHRLMPIDPSVAEALLRFRRKAEYTGENDFIFAGDQGKPRWCGIMLTDHIKPAAVRAGIGKVGWHDFHHLFSSMLHQGRTSAATQRELLRHANISTTLGIYTHAVSEEKRKAVSKVAGELLEKK